MNKETKSVTIKSLYIKLAGTDTKLILPVTTITFPVKMGLAVDGSYRIVNTKQEFLRFCEDLLDKLQSTTVDYYLCQHLGNELMSSIQTMINTVSPLWVSLNNTLLEIYKQDQYLEVSRTNPVRADIVRAIMKAVKYTPYNK